LLWLEWVLIFLSSDEFFWWIRLLSYIVHDCSIVLSELIILSFT
jgi:hypothetical protein